MSSKLRDKLSPEELKELYIKQDLSARDIAKLYNVNKTSVLDYIKFCGYSKEVELKKEPDTETLKELYINQNLSSRQVAEKLGIGATTVKKYLKLHNIIKSKEEQISIMINNVKNTNLKNYGTTNSFKVGEIRKLNKEASQESSDIKEQLNLQGILTPKKLRDLYINQNLSSDKIAEILGVSSTTVLRYLKKYDIPLKTKVQLNKDKLEDLYVNQGLPSREIAKILNISQTTVLDYLKKYDILIKLPEMLQEDILKELYINQNLTAEQVAEELKVSRTKVQRYLKLYGINKEFKAKENFTKENLRELYINQNLSSTKIAEMYNVAPVTIMRYLEHFNIEKPKEQYLQSIKDTNLEKYGTDNVLHIEGVQDKVKQTNLEKYGVEYPFQNLEIQKKVKQTHFGIYGSENPMSSIKIQEKVFQTNLERYGIPYTCLRKECQEARGGIISKINLLWKQKLEDLGYNLELEKHISTKSYDIHLKDTKILLEINPTPTHNSTVNIFSENSPAKPQDYHLQKSKLATENGYHCIHVWDWDDEIKILNLFKKKEKIQGRKTEVKELNKEITASFNNLYHLQGNCLGQQICLGLYHEDDLVSLMSFGKPRYNKNYQYELLRYTTHPDYMVLGGAEKLFKHFVDEYNPKSILTYCDYSKFSGQVYEKLGFKYLKHNRPTCHWIRGTKRITQPQLNKYGFDKLLGKEFGYFGKNTNNQELMLGHGFLQMFDCGQLVFEWRK